MTPSSSASCPGFGGAPHVSMTFPVLVTFVINCGEPTYMPP